MRWKRSSFLLGSPELCPNLPKSFEVDDTNLELAKMLPVVVCSLVATTDCYTKASILAVINVYTI